MGQGTHAIIRSRFAPSYRTHLFRFCISVCSLDNQNAAWPNGQRRKESVSCHWTSQIAFERGRTLQRASRPRILRKTKKAASGRGFRLAVRAAREFAVEWRRDDGPIKCGQRAHQLHHGFGYVLFYTFCRPCRLPFCIVNCFRAHRIKLSLI